MESTLGTVLGFVITLLTIIGGGYAAWMNIKQNRQREAVGILTLHIERLEKEIDSNQRQIAQKQDFIDELYELHSECELAEETLYGWIERANDRLVAYCKPGDVPLELPPRRTREKVKRAQYLKEKAAFNTAMSAETASQVIKRPATGGAT